MKMDWKRNQGFTIVEIIGSVAILAILAVFVVSIYSYSVYTVGKHAKTKLENAAAAAGIENKAGGYEAEEALNVQTVPGNFQIDFSGTVITEDGSYYKSPSVNGNTTYYYFVPN